MLACIGVAELGEHRQTLERLELVLLQLVRAAPHQRLELARAESEDLGLLAGRLGVVSDLERLDAQVGATVEQRLVLGEPRFLVIERQFELAEAFVHRRQFGVREQLELGPSVVSGDLERLLVALCGLLVLVVLGGEHAVRHHQREADHTQPAVTFEQQELGLVEAGSGTDEPAECAVRVREPGQDLGDHRRVVFTRQFEGLLRQHDRRKVLMALGADLGHVRQRANVVVGSIEALVRGEGRLVGDEGPVGVTERVVDGRNGVEEVALVDAMVGEPIQLERLECVLQGFGVVAGVVVHEADEVESPDLDHGRTRPTRQVSRVECDREGLVGLVGGVRDRREPVERLGLTFTVGERAGQHAGLLRQGSSCVDVDALGRVSLVEERADGLGDARTLDVRRATDQHLAPSERDAAG